MTFITKPKVSFFVSNNSYNKNLLQDFVDIEYIPTQEIRRNSEQSNHIQKLHKYISSLEEKQISDQEIFLRRGKSLRTKLTTTMTCSICLLEFKDENSLNLHKKDHLDKSQRIIMPTIQCKICKIKFTEKIFLNPFHS